MTESKSLHRPGRNNSKSVPSPFCPLADVRTFPAKVKSSSRIQTKRWSDHVLLIVDNTPMLHKYTTLMLKLFIAFITHRPSACIISPSWLVCLVGLNIPAISRSWKDQTTNCNTMALQRRIMSEAAIRIVMRASAEEVWCASLSRRNIVTSGNFRKPRHLRPTYRYSKLTEVVYLMYRTILSNRFV